MDSMSTIVKQTLISLSNMKLEATPKAYGAEFCNIAKNNNITVQECDFFKKSLEQLSQNEINEKEKISNIYELTDILLKRASNKNLDKMSKIVQQFLKPSISLSINDDLESFSIKIGDSPSLLFESSIQQEMEKFIEERFDVDQRIVAQKTADIARLVSLMNKYLGDAIDSSKNGSSSASNIKNELQSIDIGNLGKDELNKLQTKLVNAASTMEAQMDKVSKNLQDGRNEVNALEEKIKKLEQDLAKSKEESSKDHLTGLLTRRAYDKEIENFEEHFLRDNQDYALIFFDLDFFKKVNDNYGHDCGDVVLRTFAQILLKLTRKTNIVGRFGGEEFIAAIKYNDEYELKKYLKRVKTLVTTNKFKYENLKLNITFSAGVDLRSNHKSYEDTLKQTDTLLYNAKESGRNQIHLASGTIIK
jgi:diguanylate cyclase (GGDEF)-like protein